MTIGLQDVVALNRRSEHTMSGYGAYAPRLWPPASLYLLHPWSRNPTYSSRRSIFWNTYLCAAKT